MRIELREMNAEARRAQLDIGQIGRRGLFQSLRDMGWEREFEAGVQTYDDTIAPPIVACSNRDRPGRAALPGAAGGGSEFVKLDHESFSTPRKAQRRCRPVPYGFGRWPDAKSHSFRAAPPAPPDSSD